MLIVQICDFGNDGDAEYRMHSPVRQLGKVPGLVTIDCHFSHRCLPRLAEIADVLVVQFVNDWELLSLCQRRREAGRITVFEANDDFFDLQPWSPIADAWLDRTVQELYLKWLVTADGVQSSTEELARRWRERGATEVAVFPNQLVTLDPLHEPPDRPLTVGWGGSPGHFADWYQLAPFLTAWLRAHPEVHLSVMTHDLAQSFIEIEPHRYHFTKFGSLSDYVRFLRSLDIGLAPLVPSGYNRGRSDVKFLEYASQGVAGIYTRLEPYESIVEHGVTGLLSRSPREMIEHLELLRTNPDLRYRLRQQAYHHVLTHRQLPQNVGKRVDWYRSLMKRSSETGGQVPDFVPSVATSQESNYWQLRPQEPEQLYLGSMPSGDSAGTAKALGSLLEKEPEYLPVLARQAQLLNDLRDHRQALTYLERARAISPKSPRVLSEIGRAWFLLNDLARARQSLEEAIQSDGNYMPAWQYLLRMLSLSKMPDGPDWARRAEERFPTCYPLTLLSAQLYSPEQSVVVLLRIVDRMGSTLVPRERQVALRAFRQSLVPVIQSVPSHPGLISVLRRGYEVFPESAWLANELGFALGRTGKSDEAYVHHAAAFALRAQANLYREEFPNQQAAPWEWQWAEYIERYEG
jgi:tetratricopeptide (TPR) repeat protein